ncbi:MAG: YbaB/EbfC family nucleoid-associated protein [Proteobacteria bacterium]|nr:YbaB/EbfC family nucleoid-associated protein [Pseudomonadota bacterium]
MEGNNKDLQAMIASFMQNAKKMDENMRSAYSALVENKNVTVQGKAGGELVVAHVGLSMQVERLDLAPSLFDEPKEVIAELVVAAVNQGLALAKAALQQELAQKAKQIGLPPEMLSAFK